MSKIYWDSMVFVYLLEGNQVYLPKIQQMLLRMQSRGDTLLTSVLTLGEVLTGPRRVGAVDAVTSIKAYFSSGNIDVLPFDADMADRFSILRATLKVGQADAIHLATAASAGADLFVTNDKALWSLVVPGIKFIMDLDGTVH